MSQIPPNDPSEEAVRLTAEILRGMIKPAETAPTRETIRPAAPLTAPKAVEASEVPEPAPEPVEMSAAEMQVIKLIQKVEGIQRTIQSELHSQNFINAVVTRLLSTDALLPMVQQTVSAALNELKNAVGVTVAPTAVVPLENAAPVLIAFRATLHNEGPSPGAWTPVRVAKLAANHPTNPDGFECFIDEHCDGRFEPCAMNSMATTAVAEAFAKHGISDTGVFYWCELNQIWDKPPIGEDYVVISSGEKTITTVKNTDQISTQP